MSTPLDELAQEIDRTRPELQDAAAVLRAAARSVNEVGRLASTLQREAQDCEFDPIAPHVLARLHDLLQRTGYVNLRAGELASRLRELHTGLTDLQADAEALLVARQQPPRAAQQAANALTAQRNAAPDVALVESPVAPGDGGESAEELGP